MKITRAETGTYPEFLGSPSGRSPWNGSWTTELQNEGITDKRLVKCYVFGSDFDILGLSLFKLCLSGTYLFGGFSELRIYIPLPWTKLIARLALRHAVKARVNLNAVFSPLHVGLTELSRSRFKQSKNPSLITQFYDLGIFVNFWVIFGYI